MLNEAMLAMRVTDMEYAPDIKRLLIAGKRAVKFKVPDPDNLLVTEIIRN